MRIVIHTMYFLPDFGSAPILINELASFLAARGHRVEVVTTIPRERTREFRGLFYSQRISNGFRTKRFWTNSTPHPLGRLLAWNIYSAWTLANLAALRERDIVFLRTPPLQLGLAGFLAKAFKRAKVFLNVQDIHPDLSIESGILRNPLAIGFAQGLEKWVYGISDHIVVISEGFRRNLLNKGVPEEKMTVLPNWVDTDFLRPLPKDNSIARKYGLADRFVVMYSGTISISSNLALERVLEAAGALRTAKDVLFVIIGEGLKKESLQIRAESLGLDNVLFLPFQPYGDLPALLASADVLLVPLDTEKSQLSVPSKLYNFMAAARPILGLAPPDSEVASIILGTQSGRVASPQDPSDVVAAVLSLKNSPEERDFFGSRARIYVLANFGKDRILANYENLLWTLAG